MLVLRTIETEVHNVIPDQFSMRKHKRLFIAERQHKEITLVWESNV
jgi:ribosomal protein S10